jgi:hypothetical protein
MGDEYDGRIQFLAVDPSLDCHDLRFLTLVASEERVERRQFPDPAKIEELCCFQAPAPLA